MTLNELYPAGTKLADVPPFFEGMPLREWLRLKIQAACDASPGTPDGAPGTKWRGKSTSHRDNYGMKGI